MEKKPAIFVFGLIHTLVIVAIAIYAFGFADRAKDNVKLTSYDKWQCDGKDVSAADVEVQVEDGVVTISNTLPSDLKEEDFLCFIGHNVRVEAYIGDEKVYEYDNVENLTGAGYGDAKNCIYLGRDVSGQEVTLKLKSVFHKSGKGYIKNVYIGNSDIYLYNMVKKSAVSAILSCVIIFFGVLMLAIFIVIPNKDLLPYNIGALGISAVLLGSWCLVKSGVPQLVTGDVIAFRVVEYFSILMAEYPVTSFVHTFTHYKKRSTSLFIFGMCMFFIVSIFVLRFVFNIDMHNFVVYLDSTYGLCFLYMFLMLMKDRKLCDQNGIEHNTKYFDRGAMFFVLGSAIDVLSYLADWKWFQTNGSFARLGFCLFVFLMLLHFLEWWSTDRATLISYGYNDIMTGVLNRRAFETLQKMFDPSISYGYIMCDINGLKVANDTMGHEAGDELIKGVAACLSDVFGDENVYRIGGDEFVAISYASDKVAFDNEVSKLKRLIKAADKSASLGCVYSENGEHGFEEAMEMADKLMYEAKEEFYKTRDRRNS